MLTYRGTVYPWHCDHMGHMNVMWYVGKFDEATWQLFGALGLTRDWLAAHGRGMVAVDQRICYHRELRAGAGVSIRTTLREVHARKIVFTHSMSNDADAGLAADTTLVGVHFDTVARKACELPAPVLEAARALITSDGSAADRDGRLLPTTPRRA